MKCPDNEVVLQVYSKLIPGQLGLTANLILSLIWSLTQVLTLNLTLTLAPILTLMLIVTWTLTLGNKFIWERVDCHLFCSASTVVACHLCRVVDVVSVVKMVCTACLLVQTEDVCACLLLSVAEPVSVDLLWSMPAVTCLRYAPV